MTGLGRATANILFRSTPQMRGVHEWHLIDSIDPSSAVYGILNSAYNALRRHDFREARKLVESIAATDVPPKQSELVRFAQSILRLEISITRGRVRDIKAVIKTARKLAISFGAKGRGPILYALSVALQQAANLAMCRRRLIEARRLQDEALDAILVDYVSPIAADAGYSMKVATHAIKQTHIHSITSKFIVSERPRIAKEIIVMVRDMSPTDGATALRFDISSYLASDHEQWTATGLDNYIEAAQRKLEELGYGHYTDYRRSITLRRRWWCLSFVRDSRVDVDLLKSDVEFWKKNGVQNELRELLGFINRCESLRVPVPGSSNAVKHVLENSVHRDIAP